MRHRADHARLGVERQDRRPEDQLARRLPVRDAGTAQLLAKSNPDDPRRLHLVQVPERLTFDFRNNGPAAPPGSVLMLRCWNSDTMAGEWGFRQDTGFRCRCRYAAAKLLYAANSCSLVISNRSIILIVTTGAICS
jgi:hypothetical protein